MLKNVLNNLMFSFIWMFFFLLFYLEWLDTIPQPKLKMMCYRNWLFIFATSDIIWINQQQPVTIRRERCTATVSQKAPIICKCVTGIRHCTEVHCIILFLNAVMFISKNNWLKKIEWRAHNDMFNTWTWLLCPISSVCSVFFLLIFIQYMCCHIC